jgi:hypothetical protein
MRRTASNGLFQRRISPSILCRPAFRPCRLARRCSLKAVRSAPYLAALSFPELSGPTRDRRWQSPRRLPKESRTEHLGVRVEPQLPRIGAAEWEMGTRRYLANYSDKTNPGSFFIVPGVGGTATTPTGPLIAPVAPSGETTLLNTSAAPVYTFGDSPHTPPHRGYHCLFPDTGRRLEQESGHEQGTPSSRGKIRAHPPAEDVRKYGRLRAAITTPLPTTMMR